MAFTYIKIASVTVSASTAAAMEFTSIPADYTDLVVKFSARFTVGGILNNILVTFNNNASNYSERLLYGEGSGTPTSSNRSGSDFQWVYGNASSSTASTFSSGEMYIPNYASSNNKSVSSDSVTENNATANIMAITAGLWADSAAITSIKLNNNGGSFVQHSTATLYGIKKD